MFQSRSKTLWPALIAATVAAAACDRPAKLTAPTRTPGSPSFWFVEANDRMTGGGKLGDGHDFATFGFNARPGQGQIEWVQHYLDGINPASQTCAFGQFTFHGSTVTDYAAIEGEPTCRTWAGTGDVKLKDPVLAAQYNGTYQYRVDRSCDNGEPGRGRDYMSITIGPYHRGDILIGGNIQLHKGQI